MSSNDDELLQAARRRGYTPARRRFLELICLGLIGGAASILAIPFVAGALAPLLAPQKGVWRTLGPVDHFKLGNFVEVAFDATSPVTWNGVLQRNAVWLRRDRPDHFIALTIYCQHLGCGVVWEPSSQLFFCPCHGGVYYADGAVAAGPPPRPLPQYPTRIRNGHVQVYTAPIPYA
jgi:menaquinol-cytochrome c reductase iron-sulfur subunit